jgi:hypothetical protein
LSGLKQVYSKLGDYILFSQDPTGDSFFFSDSFNNQFRIDFNSSLLNATQCDVYLNFTSMLDYTYQFENVPFDQKVKLCPYDITSPVPILHLPACWLSDSSHSKSKTNSNDKLLTFFRNTLCTGGDVPSNYLRRISHINTSNLQSSEHEYFSVLELGISLLLRQRYEPTRWKEVFTNSEWRVLSQTGLLEYRHPVVNGGIVIWIGSENKLELIRTQTIPLYSSSLAHPFIRRINDTSTTNSHTTTVIPWVATEALYSCRKGSTKCHGSNGKYKFIPKSDINYMSSGWGCAQRRPLRALAHVLSLFDPLYIVILDDDTFFNFPLFLRKYSSSLMNEMMHAPIVLGEFVGRSGDKGHLSKLGMMAGGSGYILGKALLNRLAAKEVIESLAPVIVSNQVAVTSNELIVPISTSSTTTSTSTLVTSEGWQDLYRSVDHINYLSLAKELKKLSVTVTASSEKDSSHEHLIIMNASSVMYNKIRYGFTYTTTGQDVLVTRMETGFRVQSRLIDLCVYLMSQEHTCLHR